MDAVQKPDLVRKAFELCHVGPWNLSFDCITSADAIGVLLEIQEHKLDFWAELKLPHWSGFGDANDTSDITVSPFVDVADEVNNSNAHPAELIAQFLAVDSILTAELPGLDNAAPVAVEQIADELDLDLSFVDIPEARLPAPACPKRERKPNQIYLMDAYNKWDSNSEDAKSGSGSGSDFSG
jgi:hypothetical protein